MPSVHTSTAILILWALRHWRIGRIFGVAYLIVMIVVTLGAGLHYLFDLLCAIPYAYFVVMLSRELFSHAVSIYDSRKVREKAYM